MSTSMMSDPQQLRINCLMHENSKLKEDVEELRSLERQYTQRLGEMARLCDIVCSFVLNQEQSFLSIEVLNAAEEIMEYVDLVRP